MDFYTGILAENVEGVAHFIAGMVSHQGTIHVEKLHVVDLTTNTLIVRKGRSSDKKSNYALGTGGEVVNSFSPLYEIAYFFQCLFLAGVGTATIRKGLIDKYKRMNKGDLFEVIKSNLSALTEKDIFAGMKNPEIAIISNMDTDVVPLRYYKHQLWRLEPSVLTKRVAEIRPDEYGKLPPPEINHDYWTETDQQIADTAMQSSSSLLHAKIIQYYLVLQIFFKELEIDIQTIPIYFNFVPKEEIIANGSENSLLKILIALHTPEARIKYRKITGIERPWIITKACPNCGEGDKRILASKLMGDGLTVKVHCKPHAFSFRNEQGKGLNIKGCDYQFSFQVPAHPSALYDFFKYEDFSLHFAARELITILTDCSNTPLGLVVTDLGIVQGKNGQLVKDPYQVKGYGDNLDMLTSSLALQDFFIREKIAGTVAATLKEQHLVLPRPTMLFGYDRPTALVDPEITTVNKIGKVVPVSDTSALKVLERGLSVKEMFQKAVRIHAFSLEELYALRGKDFLSIKKKVS